MTDSTNYSSSKGPTDPLIGQLLFGEFAITAPLGSFGACQYYRARHVTAECDSVVCTPLMPDPAIIEAFTEAMQQHSDLSHKNIVESIACRRMNNGRPLFITAFMNGITIPDLCNGGAIEKAEDIATVLMQVLDALEYAHQKNVYHGDINPTNLFLCEKDGELVVKVSNFGFVRCRLLTEKWRSGSTGDLQFIAPEVLEGGQLSTASDIYSLGAVGVILSGGRWPFIDSTDTKEEGSFNLSGLRPDLAQVEMLTAILNKATALQAKDRFHSLTEFRKSLTDWLEKTNSAVCAGDSISAEKQKDSLIDQQTLIADLKQSVHNIVTLKYKQVAQDENVLLKVCETLSAQGPRPSPGKLVTRLVISTTCFVLAAAGLVWTFTNHGTEIVARWNEASFILNTALKGKQINQTLTEAPVPQASETPAPKKKEEIPAPGKATRITASGASQGSGVMDPSEQWPADKLLLEVPYNANDAADYRARNSVP